MGFEKLLTKILNCINQSVFEQIMNFFSPIDWKFLWKLIYMYIFVLFNGLNGQWFLIFTFAYKKKTSCLRGKNLKKWSTVQFWPALPWKHFFVKRFCSSDTGGCEGGAFCIFCLVMLFCPTLYVNIKNFYFLTLPEKSVFISKICPKKNYFLFSW